MLKIIFGNCENAIYNTSVYFKNTYQDDWITDELSVEMIKDVDKSDVIGPHLIDSPVLGAISPKELSGGVKTTIKFKIVVYTKRKLSYDKFHKKINKCFSKTDRYIHYI